MKEFQAKFPGVRVEFERKESGYRQMHQVRARTTSRNPAVHLLLVGLALLILNVFLVLRRIWLIVR